MKKEIEFIYVFVTDATPETEGILVAQLDCKGPVIPFICMQEERMEFFKPHARAVAVRTNKAVRLLKFTDRAVIETYV